MKCFLCNEEKEKLVKSHIFPIGFFNNIETKGKIKTYKISGEKGRPLQKAIYDINIVCPDCEHLILAPLDDYAIKILRDKQGAIKEIFDKGSIYIFDNVDKLKLRRFFASMLWRLSVSTQLEIKSISIGRYYQDKIREDLLNGGDFDYIDIFVTFLTDPMHNAFIIPYRKRFRDPIDQYTNGWELQFPNIRIFLSLDKRYLPYRSMLLYSLKEKEIQISTSIHPDTQNFKFIAIEREKDEALLNEIFNSFKKYKNWDRGSQSLMKCIE